MPISEPRAAFKTICVFAIHRTGTNYLVSVLRQWPALTALGEIFHPDQVHGLKPAQLRALSKAAGRPFDDSTAPAFTEWARTHPREVVEALRRVAARQDKAGLFFKVFLGHWKPPTGDVIAALAADPGFLPVILQRRCIDVYISFRKAEAAGTYKHVDTTDSPVRLDPAAYAHWATKARGWYADVAAALARQGVAPLHAIYEDDIDQPPAALNAHWSTLLGIEAACAVDVDKALARQDRNDDLARKIENADAFFTGLKERGLFDESLSTFLPTPPRHA